MTNLHNSPHTRHQRTPVELAALASLAVRAAQGDASLAVERLTEQPETAQVFDEGMTAGYLRAAAIAYRQHARPALHGARYLWVTP